MTTVQTAPTRSNDQQTTAPAVDLRRRRSTPHMLLGTVLVVACALAFAVTGLRVDTRIGVLATTRAVSAGQVLTDADLMVVHVVPDPVQGTVAQSQRSAVLGHSVRLPLAAHTLLSHDMLGPAGWPPAGQSLVAVSVKPGHSPAGLTAGTQVIVLVVPTSSETNSASTNPAVLQTSATVYAIGTADSGGAIVVSLMATADDAKRIASAPGDAVLVVQGGGG